MTYRVTITANGDLAEQDYRGLQGRLTLAVAAGTTKSFDLTGEQWNALRPVFVKLSQRRLPIVESGVRTGKTKPLMTYTVSKRPAGRSRAHQLDGALGVTTSFPSEQTLTVYGESLIPGTAASAYVKRGTSAQLTLTAARKGPAGNRVSVQFLAASGAGAITVTPDELGGAAIVVTPAAAGPGATAIAAQMAANAECSRYVTAVGGDTGTVGPVGPVHLVDGDGAGTAFLDVRTLVSTAYLRLEARKPGNQGNMISLVMATPAGPGSVAVSGTKITVTPAAAATTLTDIATQIGNDADAIRLVSCTVVGAGATAVIAPVAETFFYGGSAEEPVITVGGSATDIFSFSDTQIVFLASKSAMIAAGLAGGDVCSVLMLHDYRQLLLGVVTLPGHEVYRDSVRIATAVPLAAYTRVANVITANANGVMADVDGVTPVAGDRILLKDGAAGADNGVYDVTSIGAVGAPFVLTRSLDANTSDKVIPNMVIPVRAGTANGDRAFQLTTNGPITLNTTALTFSGLQASAHAATHVTGGGDTIPDAVAAGNSGLMSGADKTKVDAITVANLIVRDGSVPFTGPVGLPVYATIAALPAGAAGQVAYLASGRKTGEGAGVGTGIVVYFSNAQWRRFYDDATATE